MPLGGPAAELTRISRLVLGVTRRFWAKMDAMKLCTQAL